MKKLLLATAALVAGLAAPQHAHAIPGINLLVNGSFESYDTVNQVFTGWTNVGTQGTTPTQYARPHPTNGTTPGQFGDVVAPDPFTFSSDAAGSFGAYFVADNTQTGQSLRQSVLLTAGQVYEVGFDLYTTLSGANNPNPFSLTGSIAGVTVVTATAANTTPGQWQHYAATFTATGNSVFDFTFTSGNTPAKDVIADLVYVGTPLTPIPEPASLALLGIGIAGVGFARRSRLI